MAKKKAGLKSAKRFGTRYGARNRLRLAVIEKDQRKRHPCPTCGKEKAKWKSVGIWHCSKCGSTFTSKAYTVRGKTSFSKNVTKEMTAEDVLAARELLAKETEDDELFDQESLEAEEEVEEADNSEEETAELEETEEDEE